LPNIQTDRPQLYTGLSDFELDDGGSDNAAVVDERATRTTISNCLKTEKDRTESSHGIVEGSPQVHLSGNPTNRDLAPNL